MKTNIYVEQYQVMARDRIIGAALVVGAIIGIVIYGLLVFADYWWKPNAPSGGFGVTILVLQISSFVAVLAILAILGWIGYVMAATPPPISLEPEPTVSSTGVDTQTKSTIAENK